MILKGVKCEILDLSDDEDYLNKDYKYQFVLSVNKKSVIFYLKDKDQFKRWSNTFQ